MKTSKAFTLVELVLVIALLGILGVALGPALDRAVKTYDIVWSRRVTLAQGRAAIDRMVSEIRLIPSSADVVSVGSATSFQFQYPHGTPITYDLNSGNLRRNSDVLASSINSLDFKYYDSAGNVTATAASVRRVQIQIVLAAPGNYGTLQLRTNVYLRNTGSHYANFTTP